MNRILSIFCLLATLSFAGCETITSVVNEIRGVPPKAQVEPDTVATYYSGPRARPGITLGITVMAAGSAAFEAKQYLVDPEGKILMPLIGEVACDEMTLVDLSKKITELYRQYLQDPQVTAVFIYHPGQGMVSPWGDVKVLGEVSRPGPVDMPSTQDLTVMRALQMAGGATSLADQSRIQVSHCDKDGNISKQRVDLVKIGKDGLAHLDIKLHAGDVVWVPMSYY